MNTHQHALIEIRRLPEERRLRLTFADGESGELDYDFVRGYCPCATCQGHGVVELRYHPPARPVTAERIEPVGHYGISITWSDQHATGIYRFEFLRELLTRAQETPGD